MVSLTMNPKILIVLLREQGRIKINQINALIGNFLEDFLAIPAVDNVGLDFADAHTLQYCEVASYLKVPTKL